MENNGKGLFYGVIGVATLIVAIIGATFAYFTATASNNTTVVGSAATAGLTLSVTKSVDGGDLIPMNDSDLASALAGSCKDKNSNGACHVYTITVTNSGTSTVVLDGTFTLTADSMANLKWQRIGSTGSVSTAWTVANAKGTTSLASGISLAGAASETIYVAVWISNLTSAQTDSSTYSGVVAFNASNGSGVQATFS